MKTLALLLLALPLAACATAAPQQDAKAGYVPANSLIARPVAGKPISNLTLQHIARAESHCRTGDIAPSDPRYSRCVNGYMRDQFGLMLYRDRAGALQVAYAPNNAWPSPDATSAFTVDPGPGPDPQQPWR